MKKRILALFLLIALAFSLTACGGDAGSTDSSLNSDVSVQTGTEDGSSDTGEDVQLKGYDSSIEHKFIACDIRNHSVVVFDLDAVGGDPTRLEEDAAVVWEWDADDDPKVTLGIGPNYGIDSAKYRYSEYYKKDVMIVCSSNGWVGIVDYEAKSLLWEYQLSSGPHSVEMLPCGDLVVASSFDPGALYYFAISAGIDAPVHSIPSLYCHGVSWDPENECLWVLEHYGAYQAVIQNMGTENAKLVRISGSGASFVGDGGGHAFAPILGEPGKYWASAVKGLWKFDTETETMTKASALLTKGHVKGICSYSDGTVVEAVAGLCKNNTLEFGSDGLRVILKELKTGKVSSVRDAEYIVPFVSREFYKIQPFTKDYQ
ncbi:MAG: hypothetical protein J6B86_02525 [Clostridia bacterium]|nr:hypothetical protein [Clostridia bacterium]